MEPLNNKQLSTPKLYLLTGLILLAVGLLFGISGAIQYLVPDYLKEHFSFEKIRPLHVTSILFWIILGSTGGVVSYLQQYNNQKIISIKDSILNFFYYNSNYFNCLYFWFFWR